LIHIEAVFPEEGEAASTFCQPSLEGMNVDNAGRGKFPNFAILCFY
jgi:hypothetical protein